MSRGLPALAAALLLAGCSAYRLGGPEPIFRDIELAPARSEVARPGVLPAMDQALRAALAAERRLQMRPGGARLEVVVTGYERVAATRSRDDALLAGRYRITLTAKATLRSADGRRTAFVGRTFEAHGALEAAGDLAGEESRLMPRLASEVAAQVRDASIGAW
jgi:hypothetical protein